MSRFNNFAASAAKKKKLLNCAPRGFLKPRFVQFQWIKLILNLFRAKDSENLFSSLTLTHTHTHTWKESHTKKQVYAHTRTRTHALTHTHEHIQKITHTRTHMYTSPEPMSASSPWILCCLLCKVHSMEYFCMMINWFLIWIDVSLSSPQGTGQVTTEYDHEPVRLDTYSPNNRCKKTREQMCT